ncbi:MAG: hypothetical protein AAB513_02970 [Patescibacteria group bacterium]
MADEPLAARAPLQAPLAVQELPELAFVAFHLMVVPEPFDTLVSSADREMSGLTGDGGGAGAFTLTVID